LTSTGRWPGAGNRCFFDLTPHRDDKYLALRAQGVDFASAAVFGNDANDFAMLRHAAVSVFVGEENVFDGATIVRWMSCRR